MASGRSAATDPSDRLARRWVAEGKVTRELAQAALQRRSVTGQRLEEALLEVGVREDQLLRLLAETYRCQYLTTQKLAAANLSKAVIGLVPKRIAEQRLVIPVMLDRRKSVLSVVMATPDDHETLKQLEMATQVKTVKPLVARPAAVQAAIAKFYDGDDFAFSMLRDQGAAMEAATFQRGSGAAAPAGGDQSFFGPTIDLERGDSESHVSPNPAQQAVAHAAPMAPQAQPQPNVSWPEPQGSPQQPQYGHAEPHAGFSPQPAYGHAQPPPQAHFGPPGGPGFAPGVAPAHPAAPRAPAARAPAQARAPAPRPAPIEFDEEPRPPVGRFEELTDVQELDSFPPAARRAPPEPARRTEDSPPGGSRSPTGTETTGRQTVPGARLESVGDPFQLAVVLVSLLEGNRKNLRGHSIHTARMVRKLCEEFRVPSSRARAAEVASLIHDVGKASGSYHLTAYNVAQFDGHRTAARKLYKTPERVLESAKLAKATINAVHHMYERYDGKGFPDGLKENDIPLESRILALSDSYTDLTSNPRNSFRKVLSPQEACEALREMQGSVFDPKVVARFTKSVLGADLAQQLRSDHGTILLVDPDVENTTMLELALQEKLYDVHVARSEEEATQFMEGAKAVDVVVSEMDLPQGSGLELLKQLRKVAAGEKSVFVFLAADNDSKRVAQALEAGAADYLFKPIESQIVVAKVRHQLELTRARRESQESRGVSGSLEEMALPDIVQVLHQGRKSGALRIKSGSQSGMVYFEDGVIVDCTWNNVRGDQAFYELVGVTKGTFTIDPKAKSEERTIQVSAEMLLLEGMRRLDEASR